MSLVLSSLLILWVYLQVADVVCFYSESGGSLPDRVSTLQEVVSLHLRMPPSRLASLRIRSQITQVTTSAPGQHVPSRQAWVPMV